MSQKMITGYTPGADPAHIFAEDDAQMHRGMFAQSGILESDGMLACSIVDNNTVRLAAGMYSNQGYMLCVPGGSTEDLVVNSGTQGMYRKDLVIADFTRGGGEAHDEHVFTVVTGTPNASQSAATDPALTQNDLTAGGARRQEALYRITLYGVQIISIERVAEIVASHAQMPITPLPADAGTIALQVNKIYSGSLTGATTFIFPAPTLGLQNQIMINTTIGASASITWPEGCIYVASVAPVFKTGKYYRIVIEYDPLAATWSIGAIESGAIA